MKILLSQNLKTLLKKRLKCKTRVWGENPKEKEKKKGGEREGDWDEGPMINYLELIVKVKNEERERIDFSSSTLSVKVDEWVEKENWMMDS